MKRKQRSKMKRSAKIFCIVLIVLMAMTSAVAFAASGTGTGDGTGGGSDIAFALVQTKPENGATGVSVGDSIWLLFNKNVVNMTVRDINKANIILRDSYGDKVKAAVTMKDDQIEPEYRREIVVDPSGPLDPGTTYKLTIGSAVQAKNGQTLGKSYTVTFTTAGKKPNEQQGSTTQPTQNQSGDTTKDGASSGQGSNAGGTDVNPSTDNNSDNQTPPAVNTPASSGGSSDTNHDGEKVDWMSWLLVGIVLLGGSAVARIIIRKRKKKINL
jgi:flagellar basal body-associated protein FliL